MKHQSRNSFLRSFVSIVALLIVVMLLGCQSQVKKVDEYKKAKDVEDPSKDFFDKFFSKDAKGGQIKSAKDDEDPFKDFFDRFFSKDAKGGQTFSSPDGFKYSEERKHDKYYWKHTYKPKDKIDPKVHPNEAKESFAENGDHLEIAKKDYPKMSSNEKQKMDTASNSGQKIQIKGNMKQLIQKWAVIIGISNYKDTRIPPLRYAAQDAELFYEWVISPQGGKYSPSMVKLLLDENATGKNIKNALFIWLKQAIQEDMVMIYFAGHGSPESPDSSNNLFLLPYDALYDEIATSGFPMWDIETALERFIKANKVVVIADACHSGGIGQSFDIARRSSRAIGVNPISSGLQNLSQIGDGVCVISASDDKQFSQESKNWGGGHGVFTYFLLEGLKGNADYNKDKNVSLGELIPYLSEQVRRATRNAQSPTVSGKFDPALSVGR
jgi:uncharacterized caspase-like protein